MGTWEAPEVAVFVNGNEERNKDSSLNIQIWTAIIWFFPDVTYLF